MRVLIDAALEGMSALASHEDGDPREVVIPSTRLDRLLGMLPSAERIGLYHAAGGPVSTARAIALRAAFALIDLTIVPDAGSERDAIRLGADPDRIAWASDHEVAARLRREPRRRSVPSGGLEAAASLALDLADLTGALSLLEKLTPDRGVNVVNYHRVLPREELERYMRPEMAVGALTFEAQLQEIGRSRGFVGVEDLDAPEAKGRVAITFDDGYEDNFRIALPLLERASAPACVFVVTDLIGLETALWWDRVGLGLFAWWKGGRKSPLPPGLPERAYGLSSVETTAEARSLITGVLSDLNAAGREERDRAVAIAAAIADPGRTMLSWDEVRSMQDRGVAIGAHTKSHVPLDEVDADTARAELFGSQAILDERLGPAAHPTAALPRGRLGPLSEDELAERFRSVMTTDAGVHPIGGGLLVERRDGKMLTLQGRHHPAKLRLELTGIVDRLRRSLAR